MVTRSRNVGRGGARVGAGRKPKPLADKVAAGDQLPTVVQFPCLPDSEQIPEPSALLTGEQKNGVELHAVEVFEQTWLWLKERGVASYVAPKLVEQYAMSVARWQQCEEVISHYGFLSRHPTTGNPIASPYVSMSLQFMNQASRLWGEIYSIVRDQCATSFQGGSPQDDVMERLLRSRS